MTNNNKTSSFIHKNKRQNVLSFYIYIWRAPGNLQGHLVQAVGGREGRPLEQTAGRQSQRRVRVPLRVGARLPPLALLLGGTLLLLVLLGSPQVVQPEEVHRHSTE